MASRRSQLIHLNLALSLGGLGQDNSIIATTKIDGSRQQGCVLRKVKGSFQGHGKTANEGPIIFGFAIDLVASEIDEAFGADPQDYEPGEASFERANRPVFPIGTFPRTPTSFADDHGVYWHDFQLPSWELAEHQSLVFFAFNRGAALTSGTTIRCQCILLADWLKD